ncbi:MAG: phenylalanine--tRNA ligase subunit beta, partial [Desulfocapsa sp.]
LDCRVQRVNELLGIALSAEETAGYLRSIEFEVVDSGAGVLRVTVPSFRVDIEREVDLVEEIARMVGYNEIPASQPVISMDYPLRDPLRLLRQESSSILTAQGFFEAINYSFVAQEHADMLGLDADDFRRQYVKLLNPLTEDQAVMRTMLLPGMLENTRRNINFQQTDIRLFEIGKVFTPVAEGVQPRERYQLCAVVSGARYPGASPLYFSDDRADIFDIKGLAEILLQTLRVQGKSGAIRFSVESDHVQPYADGACSLSIMDGAQRLGCLGKLSRSAARSFAIKQDVFFLELDLEALLDLPRQEKAFHPLPRYPSVKRDIALLVPEHVSAGDLLDDICTHKIEHVAYADIFDVYSGTSIEDGMKSVALTVTYRSAEGTLDDVTVDGFHKKIVDSLMSRFHGRYREGKE